MLKDKRFQRVSMAALALGTWGIPAAYAQGSAQAPAVERVQPKVDDTETEDRVVVTGSNIAGAAESSALPVEVYTQEDNFKTGNQSTLEFIKSLSVVGSTVGETNQFQAGYGGIGSSSLNLRGLGGGRTLTIFNGRRFSENTNMIPSIALARTEILKDGGAVIYGADATGGVVNFITRDSFDGLIVDADYRSVEGSDGDYNVSLLWGKDIGDSNIMFSAEYSHRSELPLLERDWAVKTYQQNNTPWAPYHNYAAYTLRAANGSPLGIVNDFTQAECEASSGPVPGFFQANFSGAGHNACWWNYAIHTYNLVEEIDQVRLYGQLTTDLDDSTRFTASLSYGKSDANSIGTVASYQANVGPAPSSGTAFQYRIPRTNPYFNSFLTQNAAQINPAALPGIAYAEQFLSILFGPSGAPNWGPGEGTTPTTQLENWNVAAVLEGDFGDWSGGWLDTWKGSITYNMSTTELTLPDIVGFKVQQALNGFGGPRCNAADLVPDNFNIVVDTDGNGIISSAETAAATAAFYSSAGTQNAAAAGTNGCLYLNPFSSNYKANGTFGTPNPRYVSGNDVPAELAAWLFDERQEENNNMNLTIDALISGGTPITLPGGPIAWAAGAQWRQAEGRETSGSRYLDPSDFPCQWPGQRPGNFGCPPTGESPYWFFGSDDQTKSDQQQYSYFGEMQVPVLDNLSFQLAVRREEFPRAGLGATVYKIAGKYDPFDWLAIRGSFGTNYATPPNNVVPGNISTGLSLIARAGNSYLRTETETLSGIKPETAEVSNFGAIFNFDDGLPLDGRFRLSLDYFKFTIKDEIKTVSHNAILNSAVASSNAFVNCSAPLIERISFKTGVGAAGCVQGVTRGTDATSIRSVFGNGPGAETSGVDIDASYGFEALGGTVDLGLTATNILSYDVAAFSLNGVQISPAVDGLGFANYSRDGDLVSEWRGNATVNYNIDNHNLRYQLRYIQGVEDDRFPAPSAYNQIDDFITSNLYYQYTMPWDEDFTLSLSVENLTDEEPPFTQQQYSYDPFIGNALGRTYKVGLRKTF